MTFFMKSGFGGGYLSDSPIPSAPSLILLCPSCDAESSTTSTLAWMNQRLRQQQNESDNLILTVVTDRDSF